ncbi:putative peptidyl-tRNA hydrolase PTRHD1 [Heterodontus francisci]|uniref:putative peptidyl-tRNA hydrolase PTRHD1 n=1 Tax=Heterodontus francisci TaxID=7792 RepID=UPI00355C4A81
MAELGTAARNSLVQYVVLRGDLQRSPGWTLGALVAQACHASIAAIHLFYPEPNTQKYLSELDSMRKVVLEAPDEQTLIKLSKTLREANIDHKLWIEQPENVATCLALKPCPKDQVQKQLKKLKLLK